MRWQPQFQAKSAIEATNLARTVALHNRGKLNCVGNVTIESGGSPWTVPDLLCTENSYVDMMPLNEDALASAFYITPQNGFFTITEGSEPFVYCSARTINNTGNTMDSTWRKVPLDVLETGYNVALTDSVLTFEKGGVLNLAFNGSLSHSTFTGLIRLRALINGVGGIEYEFDGANKEISFGLTTSQTYEDNTTVEIQIQTDGTTESVDYRSVTLTANTVRARALNWTSADFRYIIIG